MPATTYTVLDYFTARIPDYATVMPTFVMAPALQAGIALYWDRFIPKTQWVLGPDGATLVPPPIDEVLLTERQKVVVALRTAMSVMPAITQLLTQPQITEGQGGPATAKFEERGKLYRAMMPLWATELKNLEAFEGIFFDLLPNVPAYLQKITDNNALFDQSVGYVMSSGTWFVKADL